MLTFYSHQKAGKYYNIDFRTAKNRHYNKDYILNKSSECNPNSKLVVCKVCNCKYSSSKGRHGKCPNCKKVIAKKQKRFCKICNAQSNINNRVSNHLICSECNKQNLGRKLQAQTISNRYKGKGNPNYVHGTSTVKIWQSAAWTSVKKTYPNKKCCKCGETKNIHLHHIIPQCFLPQEEKFNTLNLISLCGRHHKELHHLHLDIELLPILYQQYKKDALELLQFFCSLPQFQSMNLIGDKMYDKLSLVELVPRNYYKKVQRLHPEFFQQELAHLV